MNIHGNSMRSTLPPESYDGYMLPLLGRDVASFYLDIIDRGIQGMLGWGPSSLKLHPSSFSSSFPASSLDSLIEFLVLLNS